MSKRPGSAKRRGSRLAAPKSMAISSPTASGWPAITTPSSSTQRSKSWSGASQRTISSTAVCAVTWPPTSRDHSAGWRSSARVPFPNVFTVASCPALSRTMTVHTISSSVRWVPSSSTCTRRDTSRPSGADRFAAMSRRV